MKRDWSGEELGEHWTLMPGERELLANKTGATRLGFAVLLKFFQLEGRFPRQSQEVPSAGVEYLAGQIGVPAGEWMHYDWDSRVATYHRSQIRSQLGFRETTAEDGEVLATWLNEHVLFEDRQMEHLRDAVLERCRALRIEPPTVDRIDRVIRSAIHQHEERFCGALLARLSAETQGQLDTLLSPAECFSGPPGAESGRAVLQQLRSLHLPTDLFAALSPKVLRDYLQRASVEEPYELRRHPTSLRVTLLAAYCHVRSHEITDKLTDLLIDTVHRIGAKAEQRVERELIEDLKRAAGKNNLLFQLAEATLTHPDGIVREVVFPVVDEQTLRDLVKEWKATGPVYGQQLRTVHPQLLSLPLSPNVASTAIHPGVPLQQ
jgi:Domain of unknown function (DUF4158)